MWCQVQEEDKIVGGGIWNTSSISFDSIVYDGTYGSSDTSPTDFRFISRCGDCLPYPGYGSGAGVTKTVAVQNVRVSSSYSVPDPTMDILLSCGSVNSSVIYQMDFTK